MGYSDIQFGGSYSATQFGVDLYELEKAAKGDFPQISLDYSTAIGACRDVFDGLARAMQRPAYFGGDAHGPVFVEYGLLHELVVNFLMLTRTNLDDTAVALDKAARYFASNDQAAADVMNRRVQADPILGATPDPPVQHRPSARTVIDPGVSGQVGPGLIGPIDSGIGVYRK